MFDTDFIVHLLLRLPVVLFALTVHEYMHGYVALRCGDDTAYRAGRLTLNPLAHLDPIGTLCLMFAPIGWAKPVPVQPLNYRHPRRDEILVSGAGVTANFALGAVLAVALRLLLGGGLLPPTPLGAIFMLLLVNGIIVNFGLGVFNLLPIPPLDGSHIFRELLPYHARETYRRVSAYGPIVLILLVLFGGRLFHGFLLVPIKYLMWAFGGRSVAELIL
ncbi:MAG: site-2 protease family protein [Phycisphaerae bacterium]